MKKEEGEISSEELEILIEDFIKSKQQIYGFDEETLREKVENFRRNVKKLYCKEPMISSRIGGSYYRRKAAIRINCKPYNIRFYINEVTHELNHAWNYTMNKRINLLPDKGNFRTTIEFNLISEAINEAESQLMLNRQLSYYRGSDGLMYKSSFRFKGYEHMEPMFLSLCIACNKTPYEFLKEIEGKDLKELITYVSERTNQHEEKTTDYIRFLSTGRVSKTQDKPKVKFSLKDWHDKTFEYTKQIIDEASYTKEDKETCREKIYTLRETSYHECLGIKDAQPPKDDDINWRYT